MSGVGFYSFSLFVKPLELDFNWQRGQIMLAFTIFYLFIGIASPFIGKFIDRYGAPKIIFGGTIITGIGFVLLSLISNLWQFYASYAVVGIGMAAISYVPASTVVSNWFKKRRGLALGIMSIGLGAGGIALAPLVGGYLIPNFGWETSYLSLGIITWAIILPLAYFVIKTRPADMGLYPDGLATGNTDHDGIKSAPATNGFTLKMALATQAFWLIAISFLLNTFSHAGVVQNQVPYLEDIGFPVITAATALGGVGLTSAIGKLGFGWLCDRLEAKYACAIGLSLQAAGIAIILNISAASSTTTLWLYAILIGLGIGSWMPTMSFLTSSNFGLSSYGTIFGTITLALSIGIAIGPLVAGYLYDIMHTYQLAFTIFLSLYAVSIPAVLLVRRPRQL